MRFVVLAVALASGLAASSASAAPRAAKVFAPASEAATAAALITAYRQAYGLPPVVVDSRLNQAAEYQARQNAAAGSISHGDFFGRVRAFGIRGTAAENLAAGTATVADTVAMWKSSAGHSANMLIPEIRRIGLARAIGSGYGNYWTLVVSQ
jgi:uncharacterized protein YkwD